MGRYVDASSTAAASRPWTARSGRAQCPGPARERPAPAATRTATWAHRGVARGPLRRRDLGAGAVGPARCRRAWPRPGARDGRNAAAAASAPTSTHETPSFWPTSALLDADVTALWGIFAARGMGFFAASLGGEDTEPAEDFSLPPGPEAPRGTVSGRVTSALGGAPVAGVTIGLGGVSGVHRDDRRRRALHAERRARGDLPEGPGRAAQAGTPSRLRWPCPAAGRSSSTRCCAGNWASARGGATVTDYRRPRVHVPTAAGPRPPLDQSLGTAWSTLSGPGEKFLVVRLPSAIDITQFGLDPAEGCGDTAASATAAYMVETSVDGTEWTTAVNSVFTAAQRHRSSTSSRPGLEPTASASCASRCSPRRAFGAPFRDLSEFGVYGRAVGGRHDRSRDDAEPRVARRSRSRLMRRGRRLSARSTPASTPRARHRTPCRCPTASTRSRCVRSTPPGTRMRRPRPGRSRSTRRRPRRRWRRASAVHVLV